VKQLLLDGSPIDDTSGNPLHAAALEGNEAILNLLLESESFDVDARDSRERTAVYCATSRGHDAIVRILLDQGAEPLSFDEERIAKLELGRWRLYEAQIRQSESITSQNRTFTGAELTLEPQDNSGEDLRPAQSSPLVPKRDMPKGVDHLYRLIMGSAETIKEKFRETNDERRAAQWRGEWVRGPMPNLPVPNPQSGMGNTQQQVPYPGFGFEIPVVQFDFGPTGGHRIISPPPTVDELLYGPLGVDSIAKGDSAASLAICRWYHIPANHPGWTKELIRRIYERRSPEEQRKRDVILSQEPFNNPNIVDQAHIPPQSRALRASCRKMTLDKDGAQLLSPAFALHMPFIHWETEENRAEMNHVLDTVRRADQSRSIPDMGAILENPYWSKNERLLCAYLYSDPPVHPRRTLHQFYHHILEDTTERDQDQIITRYYHDLWRRNHRATVNEDEFVFAMRPAEEPQFSFHLFEGAFESREPFLENHDTEARFVMMVDQLWLWILDDSQYPYL